MPLSQIKLGSNLGELDLRAIVVQRLANRAAPDAVVDLRDLDLHEQNLIGLDLSYCDLSGVNLRQARLNRARLHQTRLVGANLQEADLGDAIVSEADLQGARLDGVHAERAIFDQARLGGASLVKARLRQATMVEAGLRHCNLTGANLDGVRLFRADLQGAELTDASLRGAELDGAQVDGASFRDADLRSSRLRRVRGHATADWVGVDIQDVDFVGAWRLRRFVLDQNYLEEFRAESRLHEVLYDIWLATSDCGRSPLRWCLWSAFAAVMYAWFYTGVDIDYGDQNTVLAPLYLSVTTLTSMGSGAGAPLSKGAQILCLTESLLGYFLFAGLLSILSAKMTRISE